jgi:lysophospholipase L1-like esterase
MLKTFSVFLGILFLAAGGACLYLYHAATRLPENRPQAFLNTKFAANQKVVVCVGDSLTHGRVSYNYVDDLDGRFPDDYLFVNAGINSELAYNVLQRLDNIIALKPDYITILIGSNDVLGTLGEQSAQRYVKKWNLPQAPDRQWFRKNLTQIEP